MTAAVRVLGRAPRGYLSPAVRAQVETGSALPASGTGERGRVRVSDVLAGGAGLGTSDSPPDPGEVPRRQVGSRLQVEMRAQVITTECPAVETAALFILRLLAREAGSAVDVLLADDAIVGIPASAADLTPTALARLMAAAAASGGAPHGIGQRPVLVAWQDDPSAMTLTCPSGYRAAACFSASEHAVVSWPDLSGVALTTRPTRYAVVTASSRADAMDVLATARAAAAAGVTPAGAVREYPHGPRSPRS